MAGLTKEQRAAKAVANAAEQAEVERDPSHITVTKDGEDMDVHSTCIKSHVAAGWKVKA